jgi:hypothetical protein
VGQIHPDRQFPSYNGGKTGKKISYSHKVHVQSERAYPMSGVFATNSILWYLFVFGSIAQFFNNLEADVITFALAASTFFFAWAAILYMTSGENQRRIDYAKMTLYAALTGLALALLAGTIASLVNSAAAGQ